MTVRRLTTFHESDHCLVPPNEKLFKKILERKRAEESKGKTDESKLLDKNKFQKILSRPPRFRPHNVQKSAPPRMSGTLKVLTILIDFPNKPFTKDIDHFKQMLFSRDTPPDTGSLAQYYDEVSYGQLRVEGDVKGIITVDKNYEEYTRGQYGFGVYPNNVVGLMEEVVEKAVARGIDFSQYDSNEDGIVDALFVVFPGYGAESDDAEVDRIWSHRSVITPAIPAGDGIVVADYTMEPEEGNIGIFCHELAHVFRLADLYDTEYASDGVGKWCLMAAGNWLNEGKRPAHLCAWAKEKLGWLNYTVPKTSGTITLKDVETYPEALKLWTNGEEGNEYFVVENRQKHKFDDFIPGSGLLISHIDDNKANNSDRNHFMVGIEQADGSNSLYTFEDRNQGDSGDLFTTGREEFSDKKPNALTDRSATMNSRSHSGLQTHVTVKYERTDDRAISLQYSVTPSVDMLEDIEESVTITKIDYREGNAGNPDVTITVVGGLPSPRDIKVTNQVLLSIVLLARSTNSTVRIKEDTATNTLVAISIF